MNNKQLREKYGDFPENPIFTYPNHYFATKDGFTMHISNWNVFLTKFKDLSNLNFLEIGTGNGRSGVWMLENILTHSTSKLTTVDIQEKWPYQKGRSFKGITLEEDIEISIRENLQPYIDTQKCEYIIQDSKLYLKENKQFEKYDFIYLDGCHEPDYVIYESCLAFQLLKKGGYLLFDDYGWGNCRYGIESFLLCFNKQYNLLFKDWQVLLEKI